MGHWGGGDVKATKLVDSWNYNNTWIKGMQTILGGCK
jgi:hypothetical protein